MSRKKIKLLEPFSPPPHRLSVEQTAAYCGVSMPFLNKMRMAGSGPTYIKLGRRVVYDTRDLDKWMKYRRRVSTRA